MDELGQIFTEIVALAVLIGFQWLLVTPENVQHFQKLHGQTKEPLDKDELSLRVRFPRVGSVAMALCALIGPRIIYPTNVLVLVLLVPVVFLVLWERCWDEKGYYDHIQSSEPEPIDGSDGEEKGES